MAYILDDSFGFEDGISQPRMNGIDPPDPAPEPNMNTAQELLIVTDKTSSESNISRPDWMHNGSFLVFRKLEQHVGAFEDLTKRNWEMMKCASQEQMAAKLMGRWKSGKSQLVPSILCIAVLTIADGSQQVLQLPHSKQMTRQILRLRR